MGQTLTDSASQRPTNVRFGVLGFACSLSLLTYLDRVCIMRVKGNIQNDLNLDNVEMGLILSAFAVGYALFEVPGGWMGDRWGSRLVIARIVLWWSAFTALTGCVWKFALGSGSTSSIFGISSDALLGSLGAMILIRFLFGCGEAGAYPNLNRVTGIWFPFRERAFAQGAVWMCARLGGAVAPLIIGRLTAWFGWRQAFWILGAIGIVWAIWFFFWFRDTPEQKPTCNDAERDLIGQGPAGTSVRKISGHAHLDWGRLLSNTSIWAVAFVAFFVSLGWYFYPTWQPEFLKDTFGISVENSEILTGLPFFCGAFGSISGGRIQDWLVRRLGSRRWGRSLVGIVGFTGAGICVVATGFVSQDWQAVTLLCLAFLINDLAIPVIWASCADIGGRYAGTVSGFMNMVGALAAIITPTMTPILRQYFDWQMVFIVLGCSWFAGAICWFFVDASKRLMPEDT